MFIRTNNNKERKFTNYRHISNNTKILQKRKSQKVTLLMEPREKNPVYNFMKQESTKKSIVDFILNSSFYSKKERRRTQSQKFIIQRTHTPNFRAFSRHDRRKTLKDIESFRQIGQNIFLNANDIQTDLKKKKNKLRILDRYITQVDRYCSFIPKTYEQNQRQILIAHEQVRKLCTEEFFKKEESLNDKVQSIRNYTEPKVSFKKVFQKRLSRHKRVSTAPVEQQVYNLGKKTSFTVHL